MQEYRVYVSQLRVGVFIQLDLRWFEHPFLFGSFKIKSQAQIETLKELGISTVICVPEKSDQLPKSPSTRSSLIQNGESSQQDPGAEQKLSADELWDIKRERIARLKQQREQYDHCEKQFELALERVQNVMSGLETDSKEIVQETSSLVKDMVSSLLSDKDVIVHLMNTKAGKQDVFYHSLNTAILGLILGREYGLEAEALQRLALGLIFHDIGKQRIDKEVLLKQTPPTPSELKLLQLHPQYGAEMLSARAPDFPPESLEIIAKHHETIDGKGYPAGLTGARIPLLVKLASIANVYDNHCNKLDPRTSLTPYQALAFMFGKQKEQFDTETIALFVRCLGVYPPGTVVQLSNGSVGMVVAVSSVNSLRPSVLLYDQDIPKNEALVFDMEDDPELTVVKSIHPGKLSRQVFDYLSPGTRLTYFIEPSTSSGG